MALEVRNFKPVDSSSGVSINGNISFDIVATDADQIEMDSLQIEILTTSVIDATIGSMVYSIIPSGYSYGYNDPDECGDTQDYYNAMNGAISYSGNCIAVHVELNPSQPFELGQSVEITVRIASTAGVSMTPYTVSFTTYYANLISDFEVAFIDCAQNIPVHNEILRKNNETAPKIFYSAFKNFNIKPEVIVRYNKYIIDSAGTSFSPAYTIDYNNGRIVFNEALDYNDEIDISYYFRFFSDEQIAGFFKQAAAYWRMQPPFGGPSNIYAADSTMQSILMIGAATFAFRSLLQCLAFQEPRLIFDNHSWEQGWTQVIGLFKSLYEAYAKDWESLIKAKQLRLPKTMAVVTPSHTLPGGRSRMFRYMYQTNGPG